MTLIPPPLDPMVLAAEQAAIATEQRVRQARKIADELSRRKREALAIYEPMESQQRLHTCMAKEVIVVGSNRGAKTTAVMVELARACTGQDPFGKYPKENGRAIVVGRDDNHLGGVFFPKLFKPGAFRIIRDLDTKEWRTYRPWTDSDREHESKPSGPMIPGRFMVGGSVMRAAWRNKKKNELARVEFINGWEIRFYSSLGKPPLGVDVDLVVFDEEIEDPDWYPEMAARLLDRHGKFVWAATPQNGTDALFGLSERAKQEETDGGTPSIVQVNMYLDDNKYLSNAAKDSLIRKYREMPDEYNVRILGQFNRKNYLMYPDFSMATDMHGCQMHDFDHPNGVMIDSTFNLYMFVDPGRQVCAATFWAVPPPEHDLADQRFLFDELYIRQCNAEIFADNVLTKVGGRYFIGFYVDPSSAHQDTIGGGQSVAVQYSNALAARRILCHNSGSSLLYASNDKLAGTLKFAGWMHVNMETNRPKLQVMVGRCPNFEREIKFYRRKKVRTPQGDVYLDKPIDGNDHTLDCSYPFAMLDPAWVPPPERKRFHPIYDIFKALEEKEERRNSSYGIHLGPGSSQRN